MEPFIKAFQSWATLIKVQEYWEKGQHIYRVPKYAIRRRFWAALNGDPQVKVSYEGTIWECLEYMEDLD